MPVHGKVFEKGFLMVINAYFSFFFRTVDVCQSGRIKNSRWMPGQETWDQWMYARSESLRPVYVCQVRNVETSGCMPGQETFRRYQDSGCISVLVNWFTVVFYTSGCMPGTKSYYKLNIFIKTRRTAQANISIVTCELKQVILNLKKSKSCWRL